MKKKVLKAKLKILQELEKAENSEDMGSYLIANKIGDKYEVEIKGEKYILTESDLSEYGKYQDFFVFYVEKEK